MRRFCQNSCVTAESGHPYTDSGRATNHDLRARTWKALVVLRSIMRRQNTANTPGQGGWVGNVVAAVAGSIISALPVFMIAALAPQIRTSLDFSVITLGALIALYYLCAAFSSVPLSWLVEAIGATRAMRAGGLITAALLLLIALFAYGIPALALLIALAGLVSGGIQPATNLFLIRRIPSEHRGLAFGFKQAAVPCAVMVSGLAVPVLALTLGWRWTLGIMAVVVLIASLCLPHSQTSFSEYRKRAPVPPLAKNDLLYLVALTLGFGLGIVAASSLSTFAVTALSASGFSYGMAGILASLGGAVAAITRAVVGIQADHRIRFPFRVIPVMLGLGAVGYALVALATTLGLAPLLLVALVLTFSLGWGWNGLFSFGVATQFPTQAARATALTSIGGRAGGVIGPFIFGFVATHASFGWAWLIAALAAGGGAAIIMATQHHARKRESRQDCST